MNPLISVIVPIYNAAKTLPRCVDSILAQSYEHFELYLVDDGSTDSSWILCQGYRAIDARVEVLQQENGGASAARNAGLNLAVGDYIAFVDADDWIEPDYLQVLLETIQSTGADLVQVGEFWEGEGLPPLPVQQETCVTLGPLDTWDHRTWTMVRNVCWGKLYRRKLIGELRFDETYSIGEDLFWNLLLLDRGKTTVLLARRLYHYVQTPQGVTRAAPTPQGLTSLRRMLQRAQTVFAGRENLCRHLWEEQLKNDLDICSKLVRYRLSQRTLQRAVRREIRRNLGRALGSKAFTNKERWKLLLVAWAWPAYRLLLPKHG